MLVPGRKPSWQQRLRQTKAIDALKAGRPDLFPLGEVQRIANWLLKEKSPTSTFKKRQIIPRTEECDQILANELSTVKGELHVHEAAIITFLPLLSYDQARGQVFSIRPSSVPDPYDIFFDHKLSAYLQCIILSRHANSDACSEDEVNAAQELLGVARGAAKDFPSILRLLRAVGHETCEALLPVALVKKVLKKSHYRDNLIRELESLRRQRKWFDAYKLSYELRDVADLPRANKLLQDIFPQYPMWASWRPNVQRITSWEGAHLAPYRAKLGPVLDLEGPDTTGQQRGTLRMSSPGAFAGLGRPEFSSDRHILDRLLEALDTCLSIGPSSVDLLIALCIESNSLSNRSLAQVVSALELRDDPSSQALAGLVRCVSAPTTTPNSNTWAFSSALPILTAHPHLRSNFGAVSEIARRAPAALSTAQRQFCQSLAESRPSERLADSILALGSTLLKAHWLHGYWQAAYVDMLCNLPTGQEMRVMLNMLENTPSPTTRLASPLSTSSSSSAATAFTTPSTPPTPIVITEDPVWYSKLDIERDSLRRLFRGPAMRELDTKITTACLKQSLAEPDGFVREVSCILIGNTDQVCVNLAKFLGNWAPEAAVATIGARVLHGCWTDLLLDLMRKRPPGMLERCAERLTLRTWETWLEDLGRLYPDHRYLEQGVSGFTDQRIEGLTLMKRRSEPWGTGTRGGANP
ncbi:hypothetical protein V8F20_012798 [Naviculisporaceae sp. PSN 640]